MNQPLQIAIVAVVIVFLIVMVYKEYLQPAISFFLAGTSLLIVGIVSPQEYLSGFANEQLAVIILLLLISNTIRKTRLIDRLLAAAFRPYESGGVFLLKMTSGISVISAFLNNTPLVAIMMPYVYSWSEKKKVSASHFLIPLSYASILGGCATLIGTSTNLIVNGLAIEYGENSLGVFDFTPVGLPMMVLGGMYLCLFSRKILPNNLTSSKAEVTRQYFVETHIKRGSSLIGKTVEEAALRSLTGLFLVEIRRERNTLAPVTPDFLLNENDKLFFVGDPKDVADLTDPVMGLTLPKTCHLPKESLSRVVEIVIAHNSPLRGQLVKNTDFRNRFNGAIMAIHRGDERIEGKLGDIELQGGDVLLVLAGGSFTKRVESGTDFYFLTMVKELHHVNGFKSTILLAGLALAIALTALNLVPLFISLVTLTVAAVLLGILTTKEIRENLDLNLIVIIALGLTLGKAMINSGLAEALATTGLKVVEAYGNWALIAGLFLLTNVLSAFMTSKAAVAIILPVSLTIAHDLGLPVEPFILIVAFGGAANFITPIGYQTNLMVYSPGRYKFSDYLKFGTPLTVLYLILTTFILSATYGL